MKEALRKLSGNSFQCDIGQVQLLQTFREEHCEFDQLYFLTQQENLICKVYDLDAQASIERFRHEQEVYKSAKYPQLLEPILIQEVQIKKNRFGVILLKMAKKTLLRDIFSTLAYSDWLDLTETVLDFVQKLKNEKEVFLNMNPWSIVRGNDGEFKLFDVQFLTSEGSYEDMSANNYVLIDICENQYLYHSPELLDQYSKCKIDASSDLFSFGIVLYELLYHKYPFDSKYSQINSNFKSIKAQPSFFMEIIKQTLKPYHQRATVEQLKSMLENQRKKVPKGPTNKNITASSTNQNKSSNIFSGLTQMFSKLTTQTEGWYLSFTENDDNRPQEKYLSLIVNKIYKKQTKLDKLVSIMLKYAQSSEISGRENQIIKTLLLILSLFRRGPNSIMNYQWNDVFRTVESISNNKTIIIELLNFCKQKISIHNSVKNVFRGNFFIDQLKKFKLLTVQMITTLYNHLTWTIDSINTKFIFSKDDKPIFDYVREIYCDEILDCISMLIFSIICMRKDNQLQLRKDNLSEINQIEKKLNNSLKKISNLSNYVSAHAIYSLEGEFFYYKEEVELKEKPYYTSLEHFYKHAREYKGLCVPQNYALNYSSGDQKDFLSNQKSRSQRQRSQSIKQKKYFEGIDSDGERNDSFKVLQSPTLQKQGNLQKELYLQKRSIQKTQKQPQKIQAQIKSNQSSVQPDKNKKPEQKKTVTFDQFFNFEPVKTPVNQTNNKPFELKFDKIDVIDKKQKKKSDDFTFFEAFMQPPPPKKIQIKDGLNKKPSNNIIELFGINEKQQQKEQKSSKDRKINNSNSQKLLQQNLLNYDWLQKTPLVPAIVPKKPQVSAEILRNILSGLKLKQLKQAITNNQEIIIEFSKLKLEKVIGSGSAGEVYFGRYEKQAVAIKKVKAKQNPNALKQFERQLLTYIKIKRNPYLVSLVGLSKLDEDYYLLTQFCNSGSLFDLLHKRVNTTTLSWTQKLQISVQVAKGMLALHQMNPPIIHRDLKSLNVFVIENNNKFTAKVADFGLSRSPQAEMMTMYLGTLHWMAPELLDNKQYSIKVDVYSYAVVLWQICTRKTPYNELSTPMAIVKHVTIEKKRPNTSSIPPDCPPQMIQIMCSCWAQDPNQRPSFIEIIDQLSKIQIFC